MYSQQPMDNLLGKYIGIEKQTDLNTSSMTASCSIASYTIKPTPGYPAVSIPDSSCIAVGGVAGNQTVNNDSTIRDYWNPSKILGRLYPNDSLYLKWNYACCPYIQMEFFGFKQNSGVGINELTYNSHLTIIPNPVSDKFILQNPMDVEVKRCLLLTSVGKEIELNKNLNSEVDVHALPEGVYFLRIYTSAAVISKKIIIQR